MGNPYQPTLLLKTIGARSGQLRSCGLPYYKVGDFYVVRGSNGGGPTDPHWAHNIRANPAAWVRIDRKWQPVKAHVSFGFLDDALVKTFLKNPGGLKGNFGIKQALR